MLHLLITVIFVLAVAPYLVRLFNGTIRWGAGQIGKTIEEFKRAVEKKDE